MPRRAILLLIAGLSVLVSTTLGVSAQTFEDPPECKEEKSCGGHSLTPQGGTYDFSAEASINRQPLGTEVAFELPDVVIMFDAHLTTTGGCREIWCSPEPHCGKGNGKGWTYDALGLEIQDEKGRWQGVFFRTILSQLVVLPSTRHRSSCMYQEPTIFGFGGTCLRRSVVFRNGLMRFAM
jgi:hypothetical protein